jgi:hypothetical protein
MRRRGTPPAMTTGRRRAPATLLAALAVVMLLPTAPATAQPPADGQVEIRALSTRADLVSGGDVLVEVVLPAGVDTAHVRMTVDGRDVTDAIAVRSDGRMVGLVEGLDVGRNRLVATLPDGSGAQLDLTNHPIGGPLFSGPQIQPWICATDEHDMGPAVDEQCNAPTTIRWMYRSVVTGHYHAYDPASPPPDVATTTTDEGHEVPYVVRIERGTANRGMYEVAVLHDPDQPWEPWAPQRGWNGKLHIPFGGDCTAKHVQSGPPNDYLPTDADTFVLHSVLIDRALSRGYAVATSSLNVLGWNCNDVVSAEALVMLKEHIAETYGEIRFTTAEGCSGGSMQQTWIAANYPGLLDGIQPACSFPDVWQTAQQAEDCHLADHVFDDRSPHLWADPADQAAATGFASVGPCRYRWDPPAEELSYSNIWWDPTTGCGLEGEDAAVVYHPTDNPGGVRCSLPDYQVNLWGRREVDGFANLPFDNVGVQYGLEALESGAITAEQFVDLNAHIGGMTVDRAIQTERSVADHAAVIRAHRGGRIVSGVGLDAVPIIDIRPHSPHEIHSDVHSYSLRDRLDAANGHHDNQIIWITPVIAPDVTIADLAFDLLDRWLTAIEADDSDRTAAQKVVANKPTDAVDGCGAGGEITTDFGACQQLFPRYGTPRIASGGPLADDAVKCALAPLDRAVHPGTFTDAQWATLAATFPDGVCDRGRPGIGQGPPVGTWQTYAAGPDGRPLGSPPRSVAFGPTEEGRSGPGTPVLRHAGPDRIGTAVAVSRSTFDTADVVVVARADGFADALAGGPLAVQLGGPLLLTGRDGLAAATAEEIGRLGASRAVLLGGEAALPAPIEATLGDLGLSVRRIGGADRYATAAGIANELPGIGQALLARGDDPADALAASALGGATGMPVLLTASDHLPPATADALRPTLDVLVVGGTAAIADPVMAAVDALAADVHRLAGPTRDATATVLADEALRRGATATHTWVAGADAGPDALVAAAAAGRQGGVLLLADGHDLSQTPATTAWLRAAAGQLSALHVTGGRAAVADTTLDAISEATR